VLPAFRSLSYSTSIASETRHGSRPGYLGRISVPPDPLPRWLSGVADMGIHCRCRRRRRRRRRQPRRFVDYICIYI